MFELWRRELARAPARDASQGAPETRPDHQPEHLAVLHSSGLVTSAFANKWFHMFSLTACRFIAPEAFIYV